MAPATPPNNIEPAMPAAATDLRTPFTAVASWSWDRPHQASRPRVTACAVRPVKAVCEFAQTKKEPAARCRAAGLHDSRLTVAPVGFLHLRHRWVVLHHVRGFAAFHVAVALAHGVRALLVTVHVVGVRELLTADVAFHGHLPPDARCERPRPGGLWPLNQGTPGRG